MSTETTISCAVSLIVPCYNTAKYLEQALSSALENDRVALEVIVLNDGSTDDSLAIMQKFAAQDERIIVVDKKNEGYGATVNRGINLARGQYVAILEPDDYLSPHMFDDLYELAEVNDFPDVVKSSYWRVWMPETPQEKIMHCSYYHRIKPGKSPFTLSDAPDLIAHHPSIWSALYRKDFLDKNAIRFKEVPGAGWVDNPFMIDTLLKAQTIIYTDAAYYHYREDLPGSSSVMRTPTLPLERWNDMMDICEAEGVTDTGILEALYGVGFCYVRGLIEEGALEVPELKQGIVALFRRMDPKRVAAYPCLSGAYKDTFFKLTGFEPVPYSNIPYYRGLVREFNYSLVNGGPGFVLDRLKLFAKRRVSEKSPD